MPVQRPQLVNDKIYHIILRGVGDSLIFKDIDDYYRGIFSIYEFNNTNPVEIWLRRQQRRKEKILGEQFSQNDLRRKLLVEVLTFCFMPNHIHLLLKQLRDNGITNFMRKVGAGYANYFNKKYIRKGHLFQGRFNAVHVKDGEQLKNGFVYIHINPISLVEPSWKEEGIKDPQKAIKFLEEYKWSSYQDYIGKKNFPSVTQRDFMLGIMDGESGCKEFIEGWIKYKKESRGFGPIALE